MAVKIKFLKDNDNTGHKKGDVDEVNDARAASWIDQGIAERVDADALYASPEDQELIESGKEKTEKNEAKAEKNAHAGPKRK